MAIHWRIRFKGLRTASNYAVNIYDGNYSGQPVDLIGADVPIELSEDDNDDMFTPVRKWSGYINIVDTGTVDWTTLMPTNSTSRPVTVTQGSTVLWQGFVQPQTFEGNLYSTPQTRKLPVCCILSMLESFNISPYLGIIDFGQAIAHIFSFITTLSIGHIHIAGGDAGNWLGKRISWSNLIEEDIDDNGEVVMRAKYSAGQLLEEICKFWGWTCRMAGTDIYFSAADSPLYPAFMVYDMQGLESPYYRQPTQENWVQEQLSGDIFASDKNEEMIMLGVHNVEVTANINKFDTVIELDFSKYKDLLDRNDAPINHDELSDDGHFFSRSYADPVEVEPGWYSIMRLNLGNSVLEIDFNKLNYQWYNSGMLYDYYYYQGSLSDLHDIPFTTLLYITKNLNYPSTDRFASFRIISKELISLDHGVIVVIADTHNIYEHNGNLYDYNGACTLICRLKVGSYYWNGSSWTTTSSVFELPNCGGTSWSEGTGKIVSNRTLDPNTFTSPYPNYNGYGIPVGGTLSGRLTFEVLSLNSYGGSWGALYGENCGFSSFSIKFLRALAYAPLKETSSKTYRGATRSFSEDKKVTTIFASDDGFSAGYGLILNTDNSYCKTVHIVESTGSYYDHPEQYLADRISKYGAATRRKIVIEVRNDEVSGLTPSHLVEFEGRLYWPSAFSLNLVDDITTITLLEV